MALTNEAIEEHLKAQDDKLDSIEGQCKLTNGRVTELEKERAVRDAIVAQNLRHREKFDGFWHGLLIAGVGSAAGTFIYVVVAHGH